MAAQPATPVSFEVPRGLAIAIRSIHGDPGKFPSFRACVYARNGAAGRMAALHQALRMPRVVIVTPSVYGTDNSARSTA